MMRYENDCWNCNTATLVHFSDKLFHAEILKSLTNNGIFDIESHTFAENNIEFGNDDDSDNGDDDTYEEMFAMKMGVQDNRVWWS